MPRHAVQLFVALLLITVGLEARSGARRDLLPQMEGTPSEPTFVMQPAVTVRDTTLGLDSVSPKRRNLVDRIIDYLDDTNKETPMKKIDYSFIGGPFYSSDAKFGIGLVAAALYRMNPEDSAEAAVSNVSLYGQLTTSLLYMVGLRGNHIANHDNFRADYNLQFYSFPTAFWGIGFDNNKLNSNKVKYKDFRLDIKANATRRLGGSNIFAGPSAEFAHVKARDIKGPTTLWDGQPLTTTSFGLGIDINLDTRDNLTAPEHGWLLQVKQMFYPRFLGNTDHSFSSTDVGVNYYRPLWRGCTLATRLHGFFSYGHTPWGLMGTIGGSYTMRGYYEARYRDKCDIDLTVELRQHVWRRSGIVVWGGLASVFPAFSAIRMKQLLPNCGIGYRWEFKKHTNVRLDFGIGRGQTGFVFNINEAF